MNRCFYEFWAPKVQTVVKNPPANAQDKRSGFEPWVGKIPWRRAWQPTLAFLPGEAHGQRSLVSTGRQSTGSVGHAQSISVHAHRFTQKNPKLETTHMFINW